MNPDRFGVVASDIEPTAHQAALLRHLVATGQPWITPAPAPPRRRGLLPAPQGRVAPGFRIAGGLSVRIYTVRIVLEAGWLLGLREGPVETPGWMGVITPAGREALARATHEPAGWDDADRVALREPDAGDGVCRGPLEAEECVVHPGELEVYRWIWPAPSGEDSQAEHIELVAGGDAELVQPCPRCRAAAADAATAFRTSCACMLGFESPEDVAPSLILASLRELLKRRNAAELALAHATMRDLEAVDTSDLIDEDPPFAAEAEEQAMRELADEAVRQRHHFETLAEQLAGGDIDGALALLREILSPAAAGPSRTSREAEGGNGAAPAARGEDLP